MATIKHPSLTDVIDAVISNGIGKNILHLKAQKIDGRNIISNEKHYLNFGTCGYLGLEYHPKVKESAIEAIKREGLHISSSRAYLASNDYNILEQLFDQIFEAPTVVLPTTTLAHLSAIPVLVDPNDAVILDQHVHASVKQAVQVMKPKGITVKTVRHNRIDMLEQVIQRLHTTHRQVWFMLDGLFSMHGDFPDLQTLIKLLDKYPNLRLYVDDAHGMGWTGKHGRGYVLNEVDLHPRMIVTVSLKKAFGASGGVLVFPDKKQRDLVCKCGGTMIFGGPLESAALGGAIASAKIHLSDEIYELQNKLKNNIRYCNQLIKEAGLPLVSESESPIFFVGMGLPKLTFNMQQRLLKDGFYSNIGVFPAVPMKCSGIRFTICAFHEKQDIKAFINSMAKHFPKVLNEENSSLEELAKEFRKPHFKELKIGKRIGYQTTSALKLEYTNSIANINATEWNDLLGSEGSFDWKGLQFLETIFTTQKKQENNWDFHYYIVRDKTNKIVLATFFTNALWKDDMLSHASVSIKIEKERQLNPNYMVSHSLIMGSLITEGQHLYLDNKHPLHTEALDLLLKALWKEQEQSGAEQIVIRDLDALDTSLKEYFMDKGFIGIKMPDANILKVAKKTTWKTHLENLSYKKRWHIRRNAVRYEAIYNIQYINTATDKELQHLYGLYQNVKSKNLSINTFDLPIDFFRNAILSPDWEVVTYALNKQAGKEVTHKPIAVSIMYRNTLKKVYCPMIIGLDYDYLHTHKVYRQVMYQTVKRALELDCEITYLGLSANIEKGKFGTMPHPRMAYIQVKDTFKQEVLENMQISTVAKHY